MTGLREARAAALRSIRAADLTAEDTAEAIRRVNVRYDALEQIQAEFPHWQCWEGVFPGILYARRPNTSPPQVVRAATPAELRQAIAASERKHR